MSPLRRDSRIEKIKAWKWSCPQCDAGWIEEHPDMARFFLDLHMAEFHDGS